MPAEGTRTPSEPNEPALETVNVTQEMLMVGERLTKCQTNFLVLATMFAHI